MQAPPRGGVYLVRVTDRALPYYLDGRPLDPRVKYRNYANAGRVYPYSSKRQNTRNDWRGARFVGRLMYEDVA